MFVCSKITSFKCQAIFSSVIGFDEQIFIHYMHMLHGFMYFDINPFGLAL